MIRNIGCQWAVHGTPIDVNVTNWIALCTHSVEYLPKIPRINIIVYYNHIGKIKPITVGPNDTGYKLWDAGVGCFCRNNNGVAPTEFGCRNVYDWNTFVDGYTNGDWMTWGGVSPDGSGQIAVSFGAAGAINPSLNAMRIMEVPEPATIGLLTAGIAALCARRRK